MENQNSSQQPNLDQEQHNNWLRQQSPRELKQLAHNLSDLAHSKLRKNKRSLSAEENEQY